MINLLKNTTKTLLILLMFMTFDTALAQQVGSYQPLVPSLPGISGGATTNLSQYLPAVFRLSLAIAALLAFAMITFGGILYATSDAVGTKSEGKEYIKNAITGLILALGAWAILYTINPQLLSMNLIINRPSIQVSTSSPIAISTGIRIAGSTNWGCNNCIPITGVPLKPGQGTTIAPAVLPKLVALNSRLATANIVWEVTEAYPPTTNHSNSCHGNGTCVDAAIRNLPGTPQADAVMINRFLVEAKTSGARLVEYEVPNDAARTVLINAGVRSAQIRTVAGVAPHFSIYY